MGNILIGLVFVIGGLSGKLTFRGTNSSAAIAAVGAALMVWGIVQVSRSKR